MSRFLASGVFDGPLLRGFKDIGKNIEINGASQVELVVRTCPPVQETWETPRSLGWEDPLEEGMATHSSIPAWRIPCTEEPGGLQSIVSQRFGHDWSDLARIEINCSKWNFKFYQLMQCEWEAKNWEKILRRQQDVGHVKERWLSLSWEDLVGLTMLLRDITSLKTTKIFSSFPLPLL